MTTTAPPSAAQAAPSTRGARLGRVLTALVAAFLLFDGVIHLLRIGPVLDATAALGFPPGAAVVMGVVELACLALYLVPRTSVLGAVLLTGYLGGAVTAQLRIDAPLISTLLFPVYTGAFVWAGPWLRDERVRALLPLRTRRA